MNRQDSSLLMPWTQLATIAKSHTTSHSATTNKNNWHHRSSILLKSLRREWENILSWELAHMLQIFKWKVWETVKFSRKLHLWKPSIWKLPSNTPSETTQLLGKHFWTCLHVHKKNWTQWPYWTKHWWTSMKIQMALSRSSTFCCRILLSCLKLSATCCFSTANMAIMTLLLMC